MFEHDVLVASWKFLLCSWMYDIVPCSGKDTVCDGHMNSGMLQMHMILQWNTGETEMKLNH